MCYDTLAFLHDKEDCDMGPTSFVSIHFMRNYINNAYEIENFYIHVQLTCASRCNVAFGQCILSPKKIYTLLHSSNLVYSCISW